MRHCLFFILIILFPLILTPQNKPDIDEIISKLSLEQKAKLVVGAGMRFPGAPDSLQPAVGKILDKVPGAAGSTYNITKLGIPSIVMADGPAGLRIAPKRLNDSTNSYYATAFPIATLLASTWDTSLVKKVGEVIGNEVLEYGVDIILMPALNLHRNPLCGRNFEYYSEDPLLSGTIAAAMVKGVQKNGVGTALKHYVANNQETNRHNVNTVISQRALRELYLKGFEIAVKQANPWTIMSSYNKVNGVYTSESYKLLTKVLRDDWGFKGFVMTDWFGGKDPVAQMKAGNDLLMPGIPGQSKTIIEAVKNGKLDLKVLDKNIKRILNIVFQTQANKDYSYSDKPDLRTHAQTARKTASEGMILLKNGNHALPFDTDKKIALFGNSAYEIIIGGIGSGDVNEAYTVSLDEGLKNAGYEINQNLKNIYTNYIKITKAKLPKPKMIFRPLPPVPEMPVPIEKLDAIVEKTDMAIISLGRRSGEFADRKLEGDFYLDDIEKSLIDSVSLVYHEEGKKVIVILNIGGVIDVASWRDKVDAILLVWQPGQEGGNSITDVISGAVNPSGKLPMTFPMKYDDVPSSKYFPGVPIDKPDSVVYKEDIYVGYRHFNTFNVKPAYEFGYGLSYTSFNYQDLKLSSETFDQQLEVLITIKNTGKVAGKEIAQLYLSAPAEKLSKPVYELKAFAKTRLLRPGESQDIVFKLKPTDLASFDENQDAWLAEAGKYTVHIGSSSLNFEQTASFNLTEDLLLEK